MEQLHNLSGSPMVNDIDCLSDPFDPFVNIMYDLNIEVDPPSTTDSNLRNSSDGMCVAMCMFIQPSGKINGDLEYISACNGMQIN